MTERGGEEPGKFERDRTWWRRVNFRLKETRRGIYERVPMHIVLFVFEINTRALKTVIEKQINVNVYTDTKS